MTALNVISADGHADEPWEIYERLPAEYRDRAPHLEIIDGTRNFVCDGTDHTTLPIGAPNPLTEDDKKRYWRDGDDVGRLNAPDRRHRCVTASCRPGAGRAQR